MRQKNLIKGAKNVVQNRGAINVIKIQQWNAINKNNSPEKVLDLNLED